MKLSESPDWQYLLQEFLNVYRHGSAGGSAPIRSHMRHVRERLGRVLRGNPEIQLEAPELKPVVAHLSRALDNGRRDVMEPFIRSFARVTGELTWRHGYDKMPRELEHPAHSHAGIAESYICLSGTFSENDAGVYHPASLIMNRSDQEHRLTTSFGEPCLLAYAWVGEPDDLRAPTMKFIRRRRAI